MSGIMAAAASNAVNAIYSAGLYLVGSGVDTSPISADGTSVSGAVAYNYTWVGYYRPATTGNVTWGLATPYQELPSPWGGGGFSIGYLWYGPTAISGFNAGNATLTSNDSTTSTVVSLTQGVYYPFRLNWQTSLPFDGGFFGDDYAISSFGFTSNGSSAVTNLIYYNALTNGF